MNLRISFILAGMAAVAVASASFFSNVSIQAPPLSTGATWTAIGNSISFALPTAIVGDPVDPLRFGTLNIEYDVFTPGPAFANEVGINLGAALAGSGTIFFQEEIYEIDGVGNVIGGGPIGAISHVFNPGDPTNWSGMIDFSRSVERFRAVKFFSLSATDTAEFDLAALGIVNQNIQVVPEPATMAVVGLGVAALLRRRKKA
jgi:hypothetical protein